MNRDELWEKFANTGAVSDYLAYTDAVHSQKAQDEAVDERDSDMASQDR